MEEQKKQLEEQKQQQGEHAAVVFSCLKDLEIPHKDKLEICKHYPENRVNHAVAYATNPNIEIKTTLVQTIKWACKEQPEIPKSEEEIIAENKAYVQQLVPKLAKVQDVRGDINNKTVQLTFLTGQRLPFVLSYTEKTFKEQLHKGLVDFGYKIDNLQEKK